MTLSAGIINHLTASLLGSVELAEEVKAMGELTKRIPGWSGIYHYCFFRSVLAILKPKRILVCGVYHGRDIVFMQLAAKEPVAITGVDLFSDKFCADWPVGDREKTWNEAVKSAPPSLEASSRNCRNATIIQGNSLDYLKAHAKEFDFIYLDTSHDYGTVTAEISAIKASGFSGLVAGDDYIHGYNWGVVEAVTEQFPFHLALFNRVWMQEL